VAKIMGETICGAVPFPIIVRVDGTAVLAALLTVRDILAVGTRKLQFGVVEDEHDVLSSLIC
jgi:hypothetical protein